MSTNDLENQIEKLETNIFQMERKNNYIKNILRNFIDIAKYYKIIDNEQNRSQSKMTKSINDIKDISLSGLFVYKFVIIAMFIFFVLFGLSGTKLAFYLYFLFENLFFISIFYESLSLIKKNNVLFEPEQSLLVKELREHIDNMNRDQNFLNELIET